MPSPLVCSLRCVGTSLQWLGMWWSATDDAGTMVCKKHMMEDDDAETMVIKKCFFLADMEAQIAAKQLFMADIQNKITDLLVKTFNTVLGATADTDTEYLGNAPESHRMWNAETRQNYWLHQEFHA